MAAILVFIALIVGWRLFFSSTSHFQRGFATLLKDSSIPAGLGTLLSRYSTVKGTYHGRPVELLVRQPIKHSPGIVRLSMTLAAPEGSPWKDSTLTTRHADISRATFDLEGKYEMVLSRDDQWLHAEWSPRAGILFPGRFDEARWRNALAQMRVLVDWMEAPGAR